MNSCAPGGGQDLPVIVGLVGGPTALLQFGGLRLLTDPAFRGPSSLGEISNGFGWPALPH
jgi:hypothetical protein